MADNFTPRVKAFLREHGCVFVRQGKGDHEIWSSPISGRRFMVDNHIRSRHWGEPHAQAGGPAQALLIAARQPSGLRLRLQARLATLVGAWLGAGGGHG